jgi:hypothetical protein
VTQEGKPTFVGSQEDIDLAGSVFELMLLQGRSFSSDHPIRQSLQQLGAFLVERGLHTDTSDVEQVLDAVLRKNPQVFYREELEGVVYYTTTRKGVYAPVVRIRSTVLPTITDRHMARSGPVGSNPLPVQRPVTRKPDFVRRDAVLTGELQSLLKSSAVTPQPKDVPVFKDPARSRAVTPPPPPPPPAPVKRVPQVETPQGLLINMSKSPADIVAKNRDFFTTLIRERLSGDGRFVSFGNKWMLAEKITTLAKGELRQVREYIESSGGPETDENLCSNVFRRDVDKDPAFCFSLNYQLASEKKVFEFVGTANQNLWWIAGTSSPRIVRAPLKPAEVGQDLKYLEDEPIVTKLPNHKWVHTLTFYEWENGVLPYSPEAKILLPPALLKEQKITQLRVEAPQFETSAYVELHYPTGNRGGWIEGLGEILAVFVSGAKLTIARNPDKADTFSVTYEESKPVQETNVLLYDGKRQRFVFQPLPLSYQTDASYLLDRQRYAIMKDVRRLDEASRRKGDAVIIFAFEKVGAKATRDEKTVYRARLEELLPIINIEKPFSNASLLRFFTTHPHYQKDETEEGYWVYIPD